MDEAVIKRIPPHNEKAERAVLGAMLMDEDAADAGMELLQEGDFYYKQYGTVFRVLEELRKNRIAADLVTVQDRLVKEGIPEEYSGTEFFSGLVSEVPASTNIRHYAEIVRENAFLRQTIKVTEKITEDCYAKSDAAECILEGAEKNLFEVMRRRSAGDFEPIGQIALRALAKIQEASEKQGMITGLATGFYGLDRETAGLQKSDLVLIAGRPAMGKTAFALNIAENAVLRSGKKTALFSLEMSKEQLVNRMVSMDSHVDAQKIRTGNLSEEEWTKVVDSIRKISNAQLYIDDASGATVADIRTKCRRLMLEKGLDLVIIDYLQLMEGSGRRGENRQQEISEITRGLKIMAKELDVPVIVLSQLSRAVEQRPDKRPVLSDLRESGAIEQDADIVMLLHRDDYYHADSKDRNMAEVIIAKQRNGPTGTVKLAWLPHITKFGNLMG